MTTNNEALAVLNKLIEQDHKVPQGAMTLGIISERLNHRYKNGFIDGFEAATDEANKRIAELESEVAESDFVIKQTTTLLAEICLILKGEPPAKTLYGYHDLPKMLRELQASNNRLRDSIAKIAAEAQDTYTNAALTKLLSATPAESLQAFENEVIEKCAKVCDHVNNQYADIFKETKDTFNDGASYGADDCAESIRTLKGVK